MRRTMLVALGAAAAAVFATGLAAMGGCLRSTQFKCSQDTECVNGGVQGRCESIGFCSFPDPSCESGQRFGELVGPQSNQCIGATTVDASVPADAPPDAGPDAYVHDARECFGGGGYELCFAMMPPMGIVTLSGSFDTTTDTRCTAMPANWMTAGQPDACMVIGREVNVTAALTVTGTRPLVLVGDTVAIAAVIDIASHRGGTTAAAANATQCGAFVSAAVDDATEGGGGGAGGSFMTIGGNGGRGQNTAALGGVAAPADAAAPTVLRGGCAGQIGGTGSMPAGLPGPGGGAIYIAAGRLTMTSAGAINASGAGATGGGTFSGGSGAGAGGMIVIHAVELGATTGGKLVANGGGGASGGDSNDNGVSGSDPSVATITTPAPGGLGGGGGGANGGNGFAGATAAQVGAGAQNNKAGGGGGGGGGYIQVNIALTGVTASPAVTIVP